VTHAVSGTRDSDGEEVATFEVGRSQTVGVPRSNKGGAGEPASQSQEGTGEQEQTGPANKDEAVSFEPVIEDVKRSSLTWCSS